MAQSQAWKRLELYVAKFFGGKRRHRGGDFSQSMPDVVAPSKPVFGIEGTVVAECKYSNNQPWVTYFEKAIKAGNDCPLFLVNGDDKKFIFWLLDDTELLLTSAFKNIKEIKRKASGYIEEYYNQCLGYEEDGLVLPIVVLGKTRSKYRIAYTELSTLVMFLSKKNGR